MLRLVSVLAFLLAACAPTAPPIAPHVAADPGAPARLLLTAEASVEQDTLTVTGTITNRSGRRVAVDFGVCDLDVRGWRGGDRARRPDIDSRMAGHPEGSFGRGCVLVGFTARLEPGESTEIEDLVVLIPHLLRDDDPDGAYSLVAVFEYNESVPEHGGLRGIRGPDREVRTRLGTVRLDAERPPLGAEIIRGRRYAVRDLSSDGGLLRATVTATDVAYRSSFFRGFDTCAVTVLAYADGADRDQAPRAALPVATLDAACGQPAIEPTIPAGAGRSEPLYASTDAPATAEIGLPLSDLLAGQPPGRYALALAVRTLGGWARLHAQPRVYLSAGEVDWPGH